MLGARLSLGVAALAAAGALLLGALIGGVAGVAGGFVDALLMKIADFVIALPAIYVVLALRAALPLVLSTSTVFWTMAGMFALAGWPLVARGVRAIVVQREPAGVRRSCARGGRWPYAFIATPSAAGRDRLSRRAGDAAGARFHPGGGDAVVRRPRIR